jgi:hypothetical protein
MGSLSDRERLCPLVERWQRKCGATGRLVLTDGRPTVALEVVGARLMVRKHRYGPGHRSHTGASHTRGGGVGLDSPRRVCLTSLTSGCQPTRADRLDGGRGCPGVSYPTDAGFGSGGGRTLALEAIPRWQSH